MLKKISAYKEFLLTAVVILVCLLLYKIFPVKNIFQQIISSISFLLVIPLLYIKIILKKTLKSYGIQKGDVSRGIVSMPLPIIISLLLFYALFQYTSLPDYHNLPSLVTENFIFFLLYDILLVGLFAALYEFFFRGVVMLGLFKNLGYWSIPAQFALFAAFFLILNKPDWSIFLYLIVAPFAGIIAYQSRSLLYSFGTSLIFIIVADALAIGLAKL